VQDLSANVELSKLQESFTKTGSAFERARLGTQIADLNSQIELLKAQGDPLETIKTSLTGIGAITDVSKLPTQPLEDALQRLPEVTEAALGTTISKWDAFTAKLGDALGGIKQSIIATFGEAFEGIKQSVKELSINIAGDLAFAIGQAVGAGESIGEAFRNAIKELLIEVPKLVGLANEFLKELIKK